MTQNEFDLLNRLQSLIEEGLKAQEGEPGKRYEGALELHLAGKYEDVYMVVLHAYLIGPGRHYAWRAKSLAAVLDGAAFTVEKWVKNPEECSEETIPEVEFCAFSMVQSTTYKDGVAQ